MNINKLINRLKRLQTPDWEQFKTIFYEEKLKEIQYTPKTELALAIYKKVCSIIIKKRDSQNIRINEDLKYKIIPYRLYFFLEYTEGSIGIPISLWGKSDTLLEIIDSIPNEEYQKIVDSFPKWNEEFKTFCRENYRQVEKILLEKWEPVRTVIRYLNHKIDLMQVLSNGEQGSTADDLKALGLPVEKKGYATSFGCENMTIEMEGSWMKFVIGDYEVDVLPRYLPIKTILEIDRSIPQWIEEAKALQHELEKQKKTKQIGENTVTILAKKLMRESGYEYQLDEGLLEIKLLYDRKLVAILPNNLAKAKLKLCRIPQSVDAINSAPEEYEIKSLSRTDTVEIEKAAADFDTILKDFGHDYSKCHYRYCGEDAILLPSNRKSETLKPAAQMLDKMPVYILLPKNRELVLRKSKTPKPTNQVLDELPTYIAAINSVPHYFNIRKVLPGDKWVKE